MQWQCPSPEVLANFTYEEKTELWQVRMREVQGAIIVSAAFQVLIGLLGSFFCSRQVHIVRIPSRFSLQVSLASFYATSRR